MGGPAYWSTDATLNDTADPAVYLVEGQSPPTLNNAVRAVMAGMKAAQLDASGSLLCTGTNVLILSTNQQIGSAQLKDGLEVAFRVSGPNTGLATLNVDGAGAKPLRRPGNLELGPGDLAPTVVYHALYVADLAAFLIVAPTIERPGRMQAFGSTTAIPPGWRECDGSAVSRAVFVALFTAIGVAHGAGDGSTTFNLPDGNGRTIFGRDNGKNRITAAGGLTGNVGDTGGSEAVALTVAQLAAHDHGAATGNGGARAATVTGGDGGRAATVTGNDGGRPATVAGNNGGHVHTGSTDAQNHFHSASTAGGKDGVAAAGSGISNLWYGSETAENTGNRSLILTFTTDPVNDHNHSIPSVPDHNHSIPSVPDHTHPIPAVPDHTHPINPAGTGTAHPNMPPAFVGVWAIKA